MRKYQILTFLILLLLQQSMCIAGIESELGDDYTVASIPEELKEGVHAVIRNDIRRVSVIDAGKTVIERTLAITILDEKGSVYSSWPVYYDTELGKIKNPEGKLYDAKGKVIRKLKKTDIEDYANSDGYTIKSSSRIMLLNMQHSSYPYTVEYHYEEVKRGLSPFSAWRPVFAEEVSMEKSELYIDKPSNFPIEYHPINWDIEPRINESEGRTLWFWQASKLKAIKQELMSNKNQNPVIYFSFGEIIAGDVKGSMTDWKSFGKLYYELNKNRDELPQDLKNKVHELTKDLDDPYEKVKALYRYVQQNTRYVSIQLGIGGWQAFDATYVHENGYGDCKALSNFTQALLKEVEIPSYVTLIRREVNPEPVMTKFTYDPFNHAILCVPMEQDTIWLECTNKNGPAGYAALDIEDRYALIATENGGKLAHLPRSKPEDNVLSAYEEVHIQSNGDASVSTKLSRKGYYADLSSYLLTLTEKEQKDYLKRIIYLGSFQINDFDISYNDDNRLPLGSISYELEAKNVAGASGERLFLPLNGDRPGVSIPKKLNERTQDLTIPFADLMQDSIVFTIPEGLSIESMPEMPITIETEFASYKADLQIISPTKLLYTRELKMERISLPPSYYKLYRDFMKDVSKANKSQIVLMGKS